MKQYLIDFFKYNDWANRQLIEAVKKLPEPDESVKLISHLINSQDKWLNRIMKEIDDKTLAWYDTIYQLDQLTDQWLEHMAKWIRFLEDLPEPELAGDVVFERPSDGKKFSVKISDIALQLNYHSIHHRAQICRIIRQQGQTPPSTDYILTAIKEA